MKKESGHGGEIKSLPCNCSRFFSFVQIAAALATKNYTFYLYADTMMIISRFHISLYHLINLQIANDLSLLSSPSGTDRARARARLLANYLRYLVTHYVCVYMCVYVCVCVCVYIYVDIYISLRKEKRY